MRSRLYIRIARAAIAGGANWVKSCSVSAGWRRSCVLALVMLCCTRRSRVDRVGLVGGQVGEQHRHPVLVRVVLVAGAHADRHRRDEALVRQARRARCRYRRSVPEHSAITTSLNVQPNGPADLLGVLERDRRVGEAPVRRDRRVPRRARRRASAAAPAGRRPRSADRCAAAGAAGRRAGRASAGRSTSAIARSPALPRRRAQLAERAHRQPDRTSPGCARTRTSVRCSSSLVGRHLVGRPRRRLAGRAGSRARCRGSAASISAPDAPSIVAWCTLVSWAMRRAAVDALDDVQLPQRRGCGRAGGRGCG